MAHHAGIEIRHGKRCRSRSGGQCSCRPTYQASVWSAVEQKRIRKTFPTLADARAWRSEAQTAIRQGTMRAPSQMTLSDAADAWLAGARAGSIRNRSGDRYKPSVIRSYETSLRLRVLPELGKRKVSEIRRRDVQDLADRLLGQSLDPSTIRNALMPLRAIFRRALARGDVAVNPTRGLELPAVRGRRDRIVSPDEAEALLAALPERDRALWATALYGGLRRGELQALRWDDVDLANGVIRVERAWDVQEGPIEPKSRAARRKVPIPAILRDYLVEHRHGRPGALGHVFGRPDGKAFDGPTVDARAKSAWRRSGLEPITLHEARHTFASLMIAAGVNAKALATYMGHASVTITLDRYGHLMAGNEDESAALLDAYLGRASTGTRLRQLG
ncbi:MAG TPA: tyrosine-type recombinase/integrase [Gaiellaceae bacterium]|nr:tyrosine-type recombinase/integrase [Gaiellaceae bacterium]